MKKSRVIVLILICLILSGCGEKADTKFKAKDFTVGNVVTFGNYEQDNITSNGKEIIEWEVLEIRDDKALVVSRMILCSQMFNASDRSVTWEDCTLRAWLNSTFLEEAFSPKEMELILSTDIVTESVHQKYFSSLTNSWAYTVDSLPKTTATDKVFILSTEELAKYYPSEDKRVSRPTNYVILNAGDAYKWWTRTPGTIVGSQKIVDENGSYELGGASNNINLCVRPAMWLAID